MLRRGLLLATLALTSTWAHAAEEGDSPVGTITVGALVNGTSGGVVVGPEDAIRERLLDILTDAGLPAQPPASAERGRVDAGDARFILNGNVIGQACHNEMYWTGCRWRILWSVVDLEQGAVLVEATGLGEASVRQASPTTAMYVEIIARSAMPLARSPELQAMLADPAPARTGWNREVGVRPCVAEPRQLPADLRTLQPAMFTVKTQQGRADGVLISPDGLAITAAGPLGDQRVLTATRADGSTTGMSVLRVDDRADLALVALQDVGGACLPLRTDDPSLGEPLFALGTRGEDGWGLRTGTLTAVAAHESGRHIDTDAALGDLSSRAPIVDAQGRVVAIAPPAGTESMTIVDALTRLGTVPADTQDSLANIDRLPRRTGEPVRLELGGAVNGPLQAPIGPGRPATTLAQAPGGADMAIGGTLVAAGAIVGIPAGMLWLIEESDFGITGRRRATYATITGVSAAAAIGGGLLVYRGVRKADEHPPVEVVILPTGVGVHGRF